MAHGRDPGHLTRPVTRSRRSPRWPPRRPPSRARRAGAGVEQRHRGATAPPTGKPRVPSARSCGGGCGPTPSSPPSPPSPPGPSSCGAPLRYHADFDGEGLRIAAYVLAKTPAQLWRMSTADYHAARARHPSGPRPGHPVNSGGVGLADSAFCPSPRAGTASETPTPMRGENHAKGGRTPRRNRLYVDGYGRSIRPGGVTANPHLRSALQQSPS